jgi:phosphatidylglycerophosphate synthase
MHDVNRSFKEANREIHGLTAPLERRVLAALARRMPAWVTPDHLTTLGLAATLLAGVAYLASRFWPEALHLVNLALLVNWFGDSLDGTLARHRRRCRPRYGFYVDHIVDAFGALFVIGGLAFSGLLTPAVGAAFLISYFLMAINVYLATYTLGVFKISYGPIGGTELRLLLAGLNLFVLHCPTLPVAGTSVLVFDFAFGAVTLLLAALAVATSVRNTARLYRLERLTTPGAYSTDTSKSAFSQRAASGQ